MKRFSCLSLLVLSILVSSCATKVTASNGSTVVVRPGFGGVEKALTRAEVECSKSGKTAKVLTIPSPGTSEKYIFECISR